VAECEIVALDARTATLCYAIDFSRTGALGTDQAEVGDVLNRMQEAGGASAVADLVGAVFRVEDAETLTFAYDDLSAQPCALAVQTVPARTRGTLDAGLRRGGRGGIVMREGDRCARAEIGGSGAFSSSSDETFAHDLSGGKFRVCMRGGFDAGRSYGMFLGLGTVRGETELGRSFDDGRVMQAGAILRRELGAAMLSGAVGFGRASFAHIRDVVVPAGLGGVAGAEQGSRSCRSRRGSSRISPSGRAC
jgi:hypothetical protein